MKKTAMIALLAGTTSVAFAAPQESVTFTDVKSLGRYAEAGANNEVRTASFTGAYNVVKVNISGTLSAPTPASGSYAREACIQATSPSGQKFIINPFSSTGFTGSTNVPAGAYTLLQTAEAAAGTWTFEFFELYDDVRLAAVPPATATTPDPVNPDSLWSSITITLDDAGVAAPPAPIPTNPSITWTDVVSNVGFNVTGAVPNSSWTQLTFTVPPTQTQIVDTVVFSGQATGLAMNTALSAGNNLTGTPVNYMLVRVRPPWSTDRFTGRAAIMALGTTSSTSTGVVTFFPVGLSSLATASTAATNNPPYQGLPITQVSGPAAGTWVVEVQQNLASATLGPVNTGVWKSLSMSLASATPPTLTEPGFILPDGGTVTKTGTFTTAGEKRWYKFTVPAGVTISHTNGNALDIGMFGTNLAPENDANMAIYTSGGGLLATSFNSGPGLLPQISYGTGIRNAQGAPTDADPGVPFDGSSPAGNNAGTLPTFRADLTAGDYYLLVNNGDDGVLFRQGLFNSDPTTETNVGPYTVMFRSWLTNNTAPFDVPVAADLGFLRTPVKSATATIDAGHFFRWYKFSIDQDANDTTGKYVDIDTCSSNDPINDTNIALYNSAGDLVSFNDDIAAGWGATNPTGGNSAMSFGMGTTARDYTAINANLPLAAGADGTLTAGTYYVQVSMCCANYQNNRFWVINDYTTPAGDYGDVPLNIRSNYSCGIADMGVQGGVPGQDGRMDNNDFIVFIDYFFNQNSIADVGVQGGVAGTDGTFDNNDFIVFIDLFFNSPADCR